MFGGFPFGVLLNPQIEDPQEKADPNQMTCQKVIEIVFGLMPTTESNRICSIFQDPFSFGR